MSCQVCCRCCCGDTVNDTNTLILLSGEELARFNALLNQVGNVFFSDDNAVTLGTSSSEDALLQEDNAFARL